jgi:uncharacterized protein (TIGR02246 family)
MPQPPSTTVRRPPGPTRPAVAVTAILVWLVPLLGGCRARAGAADATGRQAVTQVIDSYLDAYRRNDADAIAGLYATDAVLLPPGHPLVRGRDDIRAYWKGRMESGFAMDTVRIEVAPGSGYVVGRYYVPPDGDDDAETGKFVIALRREADGVWRIAADIWNADAANEPSPADSATPPVASLTASRPSPRGRRTGGRWRSIPPRSNAERDA